MEKTETTQGLGVVVRIIDKAYNAGRKYALDFKEKMTIQFDKFLPKWNYTAVPDTSWNRELIFRQILTGVDAREVMGYALITWIQV